MATILRLPECRSLWAWSTMRHHGSLWTEGWGSSQVSVVPCSMVCMLIINNGNHTTCVNVSDILKTHKNSLHFLKLHCLVSSKVLYLIFYICDDFQTHKNTLYFLKLHCLVNLLDSYYKMLYNGKEGMIKKTKTICWTYEHNSGTRMRFPVVQDDITCMDQSNNYFFTFAMISFLASRFHS